MTNTDTSQTPRPGSTISGPFIADDNHDASISDDGNVIAFASTRDLVPAIGNPPPTDDNDEIFTYVRGAIAPAPSLIKRSKRLTTPLVV